MSRELCDLRGSACTLLPSPKSLQIPAGSKSTTCRINVAVIKRKRNI